MRWANPSLTSASMMRVAISVLAIGNMLALGRIDALLSIHWGGVVWSPFHLAGLLMFLGAVVLHMRLPKGTGPILAVASGAAMVTMLNIAVKGIPVVPAVFGLTAFVFPMLLLSTVGALSPPAALALRNLLVALAVLLAALSSASVLAGSGLASLLGWEGSAVRGLSPIGGPIATGATLLLFWPWLIYRGISSPGPISLGSVALVSLALVLSGSRLIALVAVVCLLMVVAHRWGRVRSTEKLFAVTLATLILVGGGTLLTRWAASMPSGARILQLTSAVSDSQRLQSLATGAHLIELAPLIGHGPGAVYPWMRAEWVVEGRPGMIPTPAGFSLLEPHNTVVMGAVEYGLPWMLFTLLLGAAAGARLLSGGRRHSPEVLYGLLGVLAFALQATGSSHLFVNPRVAINFWLWFGACVVLSRGGGVTGYSLHGDGQ